MPASSRAFRRLFSAGSHAVAPTLCILLLFTLTTATIALNAGCGGGNPTPPPQVLVGISPSTANVLLGTTKQFTSSVTGTSNTAVRWTVNDIAGGNASVGTIDTSGLFTAPTDLPNPTNVTITATSQADSTASAKSTATISSDVAVSLSTNPAFTPSVPTSSIIPLAASIASQGKPDQNVTWSVNGAPNGNSTVGTVSSTGANTANYQAPVTVPTPFTVNISATSMADESKSASVPLIVAGTIASVTQSISAASGGTISLPDGSSVTISPEVLPADQSLTLSEVSYLPNQPPNKTITGVGPGLILTFGEPIQPSGSPLLSAKTRESSRHMVANATSTAPTAFLFSINTANNDVTELRGSLPTVNFLNTIGDNTFVGTSGNYDSTSMIVTGDVGSDLFAGLVNYTVAEIQFSTMNIITNICPFGVCLPALTPGPLSLTLDNETAKWGPYLACPTRKTLVLVHGMASTVEQAFPGNVAQAIKTAGDYDSVVGFDYDWTLHVATNGTILANFLTTLAACPGVTLDIEAHSEGVPVSLDALNRSNASVAHMISVGGPIMGTPLANDMRLLQAYFLSAPSTSLVKITDLATILATPFISDLVISVPGDKGTLDNIRSSLLTRSQNDTPRILVIGGSAERLFGTVNMSWAAPLVGTNNFDGAIPLTSALAFNSRLKVYPLPPFNVGHNELEGQSSIDPTLAREIVATVGEQVTETHTPKFLCASFLSCDDPRNNLPLFTGQQFNGNDADATIWRQDATGAVRKVADSLPEGSNGSVSWTPPACSEFPGTYSLFALDGPLASNNVTQTVELADCATGSAPSFAYVANQNSGDLSAYKIDLATGALASLVSFKSGVAPASIAADPLGHCLYVANSEDSAVPIAVFSIDATSGALTPIPGPQKSLAQIIPHSIALSPYGQFAFVGNLGSGNVSVFTVNATTCGLTEVPNSPFAAGTLPYSVAIDATGTSLYLANYGNNLNTISGYAIDSSSGALTALPGSPYTAGAQPTSVAVDPSGNFVFATNSGETSVSIYRRNPTNGALTSLGSTQTGSAPWSVAVHPSGKFVYVAALVANDVEAFSVDSTTGILAPIGALATGMSPMSVSVDPSGKFLYVASYGSASVSAFQIDPNTGLLTSIGTFPAGAGPFSITTAAPVP